MSQPGYNTIGWTKRLTIFCVFVLALLGNSKQTPETSECVSKFCISSVRTGLSSTNCISQSQLRIWGVSWLMITLIWVISDNILGYRFLCLYLYLLLWLWYSDPVKASKKLLIPFCTLYRRFNPALVAESKFFHAWNYSIQYLEGNGSK